MMHLNFTMMSKLLFSATLVASLVGTFGCAGPRSDTDMQGSPPAQASSAAPSSADSARGHDDAIAQNAAPAAWPAVETVVYFRHGEKPADGRGQLTPQGLNRALALSEVLPRKFGKPDFLFAPDPREKVFDAYGLCSYVLPLATIEPIAIRLDMPVQTPCGYRDIDELNAELCKPEYARATVFVAWEHAYAQRAAADLFKQFGGNPKQVPSWPGKDFDSLYVVTIRRQRDGSATAEFKHDREGLDGQSMKMPRHAPK